jgi:hypothetical protein
MWFKQISEYEKLIDPVKASDIRQELEEFKKERCRPLSDPTFSHPHLRYIIGLDQITHGMKFPNEPTNLRVLESDKKGPLAIHEFSLNLKKPELLTTMFGERIISNFLTAVSRIKQVRKDQSKGEVRLLDVLPLNVEAVWFTIPEENMNEFYLIRTNSEEIEIMDEQSFIKYLGKLKDRFTEMNERSDDKEQKGGKNQKSGEYIKKSKQKGG